MSDSGGLYHCVNTSTPALECACQFDEGMITHLQCATPLSVSVTAVCVCMSAAPTVRSINHAMLSQVPIVVTAEDGVTSLRYYVVVTRAAAAAPAPAPMSAAISADSLGPVSELYSVPLRTGTGSGRLGAFGAIAPSGSSDSSSGSGGNIGGGVGPVAAPLGGQLSFSFTPSSEQVCRRIQQMCRWRCLEAGRPRDAGCKQQSTEVLRGSRQLWLCAALATIARPATGGLSCHVI